MPNRSRRYSSNDSPTICMMVLYLAPNGHLDAAARADLRHPFAQRRDRDLAADDDDGHDHHEPARIAADDQHQRGRDDQLVGDRIEERAEARGLAPACARSSRPGCR